MIDQKLLEYIAEAKRQGAGEDQIKAALVQAGWQNEAIDEAFSGASMPPVPSSDNHSLPSAGALLQEALSLYVKRFSIFMGITMLTLAPLALVVALPFVAVLGTGMVFLLAVLLVLFVAIGSAWGQIALIYAIKDTEERIGIMESYRRGWGKILSYWWMSFLTSIIIFGGLFLFVIPGIIFSVWFSLGIFVLIAEDRKGMDALLKSREYVRGRWGSVFWRFLVAAE